MQIDNPTLPLQVISSFLNTVDVGSELSAAPETETEGKVGKEELRRRERTASRLLSLVSAHLLVSPCSI